MKTGLRVVLAWLPIWCLWLLFVRAYAGQSTASAAFAATAAIGSAALLSVGAWWLTGVYGWPERLPWTFYGVHAVAGSVFSLLWMLAILGADALHGHVALVALVRASKVLQWQYLMGLWIYGLVAGISYTVRTRGRLREAQALAAEARLAALRNQLNPHFLFNALHSLAVLIRNDPAAAQVAIEQLGDLLRYSLSETGVDEVPLSEEWRFTKTYLALEQIRFGARLSVEERLSQETMSCLVPSFTLQILVENAVRHGIAPLTSEGVVRIRSWLDDGALRLEVSDTGPGTDGSTAQQRGRGLRLLRERLTGLYGEGGALVTRGGSEQGFTATVTLPARRDHAAAQMTE